MSTANVWFVAIDASGNPARPTTVPPTSDVPSRPRVTTIHVVNWSGEDLKADVVISRGQSIDILVDVPKM